MPISNASFYKGFIFLTTVCFAVACSPKRPAGVLSEAEMVRVMAEIYQYEEKINRLNVRRDSAEKIFELATPAIFERVGVTDSVFRKSYEYYVNNSVEMDRIYGVLVDSLNLREQRLVTTPSVK